MKATVIINQEELELKAIDRRRLVMRCGIMAAGKDTGKLS